MEDRDSSGLPFTARDQIVQLRTEYEAAAQEGAENALEKCFK
jgi:hypothetical protein